MLRACFAVQADSVHHPCACAWAKQLKHWELKRNRTEWQTSAWWACPFELMGLKCVYVERSSIRGPWGPCRSVSPCLHAPLIITFKWNVNPRSPHFLPCQYLFDSCLARISSAFHSSFSDSFLFYSNTLSPSSSISSFCLSPQISHFSLFHFASKSSWWMQAPAN